MNTANKLTLLRVVMIPAFLLVLYLDVPGASYWALAIFVGSQPHRHPGRLYRPALQPGHGLR